MIYNVILAATLIAAFFMCISAYCLGLKHGKLTSNGNVPAVQLNPVKKIIEAVEQHEQKKEENKLNDELTDIMGATRETMLEAIKKAG